MKLSQLASLLKGKLIGTDTEAEYNSVSIDTRTLKPNGLFVAIKGQRFDGHDFLDTAKKLGAAAAVVEKTVPIDLPTIQVADTRHALGLLAQWHRKMFTLPVIALTGSCGKTTTKEMIRSILSHRGPVLASSKSYNNEIGVPLTLLELNASHRFAVIEMGANHLGEIAYLTQLTQPTIALVTNIAPAHLEGFGSLANVAKAKAEIFLGLAPSGVAIINTNDSVTSEWPSLLKQYSITHFGLNKQDDIHACDINLDPKGKVTFTLVTPLGHVSIRLALLGQHNLMNALAAAAVSYNAGASLQDIKLGLETTADVAGRLTLIHSQSGALIIDDTYNANPQSVTAALKLLAHYSGRRIFVLGDMGELGSESGSYHLKMGQLAKDLGIETVYTCGKLSALTAQGFGPFAEHFDNQQALIQTLKPTLAQGVTVLIKGSRIAQMEKVVAALINN